MELRPWKMQRAEGTVGRGVGGGGDDSRRAGRSLPGKQGSELWPKADRGPTMQTVFRDAFEA